MDGCTYFSMLRKPLNNTKLLQEKKLYKLWYKFLIWILQYVKTPSFLRILELSTHIAHCQKVGVRLSSTIRALHFDLLTRNIKWCPTNIVSNASEYLCKIQRIISQLKT